MHVLISRPNKVLTIDGVFSAEENAIPLLFDDHRAARAYRNSHDGDPEFQSLSASLIREVTETRGYAWSRQLTSNGRLSEMIGLQPAIPPEPKPIPVPVFARAWFVSFIYFENDTLTTAGNSLVHTNIERITGPDDIRALGEVVKMYNQFPPEMSLALLNYKREPAADREVKNPDQVEEVPAPAAKGLRLV